MFCNVIFKTEILTAGDEHVCAICREAETKIFKIEDGADLVPFHPLCRCSVIAHITHSLPEDPVEDTQPVICLNENTANNVRFNSINTNTNNINQEITISAKEEFNQISGDGYITIIQDDGSKRTYYVKCNEKYEVDFPTEDDLEKEICYEYQIFNDEKMKNHLVTFYRSHSGTNVSVTQALNVYDWLPEKLRMNCEEIVLSKQESGFSAGYVYPDYPSKIVILKPNDSDSIMESLTHEMAHCFDITHGYISNKIYASAFEMDLNKMLDNAGTSVVTADFFMSQSAFEDYVRSKNSVHIQAPYAEDFADVVTWFLKHGGEIKAPFIEKTTYLKKLLYN